MPLCPISPSAPAPNSAQAAAEDLSEPELALQLQVERERLARMQRRVLRLRQLLNDAHEALHCSRVELSQAWQLAGRDTLTGLANRRGFEPPLHRELARHAESRQVLALLFVDLDGFKLVNDRLGHAVGDELLRIVGARLVAGMRRSDLVCRHGGDEFVCLLPQLHSAKRARTLAASLLRSITRPCMVGGQSVQVQASIGVAIYPRDGDTLPTLLRSADTAMYAAKAVGAGVAMARQPALPAPAASH